MSFYTTAISSLMVEEFCAHICSIYIFSIEKWTFLKNMRFVVKVLLICTCQIIQKSQLIFTPVQPQTEFWTVGRKKVLSGGGGVGGWLSVAANKLTESKQYPLKEAEEKERKSVQQLVRCEMFCSCCTYSTT